MKIRIPLVLALFGICVSADAQENPLPKEGLTSNAVQFISDEEYGRISGNILARLMALKETLPSLLGMTSASHHEYNVTWILDDATRPHDRLNGRRAAFGKDGYYFSLTFFRGEWKGAALFRPVEFGDLKLWFNWGHDGNTSVIAAITTILQEEKATFCRNHPEQCPNLQLQEKSSNP